MRTERDDDHTFSDPRLVAGGALALIRANARYWSTVAPLVRSQLALWERRARAIPDPGPRALATSKLAQERFNVEAAATLSTLAPRARRADAVTASVALQVMYDYLDALTERPLVQRPPGERPREERRALMRALSDAVAQDALAPGEGYRGDARGSRDGGYLQALVETVRRSLARLPAARAIDEVAQRAAARCAQAQLLSHTSASAKEAAVRRWAPRAATDGPLDWPELLAGASASVLGLHALIAAAADERTTRAEAERIDAVYLSIGALSMLDSLVDREQDRADGRWGYADCYQSPEQMARALADVARGAARDAQTLPHAAHHTMTLVGVVAYYASAPTARSPFARGAFARLHDELRPLIVPTTALMRAWRMAKSARDRSKAIEIET
jgi:hypothetical protein